MLNMITISCLPFSPSDWIQLFALAVVAVYTTLTYLLWRDQRRQFQLAQRPWVYPGDVTFHNDPKKPELAVLLYNFGKLPAFCNINVSTIDIKPFPDQPEQVHLISEKETRHLAIFPYIPEVDTVFMFLLPLTEEQRLLLIDGCRLDMTIDITYKDLTNPKEKYAYSYSATLEVHQFKAEAGKQATLIRDARAN